MLFFNGNCTFKRWAFKDLDLISKSFLYVAAPVFKKNEVDCYCSQDLEKCGNPGGFSIISRAAKEV